ncbi:predicted protein [Plenodomus lingam JN3]|uniref:Predicted protein n=1 Tax=Leptosphaeria maculans (strain JN3 / isolate v23.1.3 / race Av1-4-5-6-7-8) TaxID=985895 RepID=E4ZNN2_LEPMJ|nr:predicted protein [Plenodomus lingam JN3]CBX93251.1 predicted protein [Plenodomus lingam JN3]
MKYPTTCVKATLFRECPDILLREIASLRGMWRTAQHGKPCEVATWRVLIPATITSPPQDFAAASECGKRSIVEARDPSRGT